MRRGSVIALVVFVFGMACDVVPVGARQFPSADTLEDGDLVWPKNGGQFVPFNSEVTSQHESNRKLWEEERAAYIKRIESDPNAATHKKQAAKRIATLSFDEFEALYLGGITPGTMIPFGDFPLYVGHVGVILFREGKPMVVEAVLPEVRMVSYADWLRGRPDADVWHGRLNSISEDKRASIAQTAVKEVGKPYDFWNLDLDDNAGFYCSKLVWYAVSRAVGIAMDNNPESRRSFWYSPKQLVNSPHVELILNPRPFGAQ